MTAAAAVAPAGGPSTARMLAQVLAAGLGTLVVAALVALALFERHTALSNAQDRAELIARALEDHVTRTIDSTALVLNTLGGSITQLPIAAPQLLQPLLSQSLVSGLPFLRSVAVIDEGGWVLASTLPAEQGLRLNLSRLGARPAEGSDLLLPLMPGRSLADLLPGARAPRANGVGMLPLLRSVQSPGGQRLLLVALINPGALANFQQAALAGNSGVALLSSLNGQLIAASRDVPLEPGQAIRGHPVFDELLPAQEHGRYLGTGVQPGPQVVAFRASRTRPLVVTVEQPEGAALVAWQRSMRWLWLLGVLALLAIAGGTWVLLREMRAREGARAALDQAHRQVALRERELSVLLKSVQELIFRTDASGALTFVNARWAALSEQGPEQAIGRRLQDLASPADQERLADLFRLDDRAGARQAQVCMPAADGTPRHFFVAVAPLHNQGRIVGFAGSAVDISERVASDQQLQHQLAFTGLLLEISPLPVAMCDATRRYVTVNQAWEDFSGHRRAAVIGQPASRFMSREEAVLHAEQDARLIAQGSGTLRYETQMLHRDGSRRDVLITKVWVPGDTPASAGILSTLMDVSEFRDAERATREARDAAEQASLSKSEFVANMSHELRTPLQAILGFSELGQVRGAAQPKLAGMFADIHASGRRMLGLVDDLLDVAKIESAVGTFHLEPCDLRAIVKAVLRELDPLLARRQLRLALRLPDQPLDCKADPSRLHQAVRNVVANAIKFSPEGGALDIHGRYNLEGEVHLSVADHGPGVPPAELESIFEAFVQSSQTKDGSGGTGLGLAICRKIMQVHGGHIWAESRPGGGSVFHLSLPQRVHGDTAPAALD